MSKDILVFIEVRDGVIAPVSFELLGSARNLASINNSSVVAALISNDNAPLIKELKKYDIDGIVSVEDATLKSFINDNYTAALTSIIDEVQPNVILVGATSIGRDLAPRISARLKTGLTADCTKLEMNEEGSLFMTRPAFGGNLIATIICPNTRPQMSTVRPGVMPKIGLNVNNKDISVKELTFNKVEERVTLVEEVISAKSCTTGVDCADLLVSIGRGVNETNEVYAREIAHSLKGAISCTRPLVDCGRLDHALQVGQTGTTVKPEVYFALGISGAIQHVVGMENSNCIIAVNKDAGAPIFTVSDLGIIGDVSKILPLLNEAIKKER